MSRKKRRNWALWFALIGTLIFLLAIAAVASWSTSSVVFQHTDPLARSREFMLTFLASAWFFALGAAVGSFLNVVVHRMPQGISITGSSRCPYCVTEIHFSDNIPVFGWLALRGRCRACRLPISPRYPLVELACAVLLVGLLYAEFASGGANLPLGARHQVAGFERMILDTKWDMARLYSFHGLLLWMLLAFALINLDGHRIPRRLVLLGGVVGLLVPVIWKDLGWKVHYADQGDVFAVFDRFSQGITGFMCGLLMGICIDRMLTFRRSARPGLASQPIAATFSFALVGLYLGWRSAISVAMLSVVFYLCTVLAARWRIRTEPIPFLFSLLAATFLQIHFWAFFARLAWWPGPNSSSRAIYASCAAIIFLALLARRCRPRPASLDGLADR